MGNSLLVKLLIKSYHYLFYFHFLIGAGEKSFCAGGDVVSITKEGPAKGAPIGKTFFQHEYALDHLIGHYKVPYVALLDGYTMGGGVGLSVHGMFKMLLLCVNRVF